MEIHDFQRNFLISPTIGASLYETDNPEGTTGKYEETEISVSFAF